jgi:hypothetical protein
MLERLPSVIIISRYARALFLSCFFLIVINIKTSSSNGVITNENRVFKGEISQPPLDISTSSLSLDSGVEKVQRASPNYHGIITGELASSSVVWNTSLSFTTAPFTHDNELRLAFIANKIKNRFTELKVLPSHTQ